jgi:hypothetical protein
MKHIGLDFDNTIVNYYNVYKSLAQRFNIPTNGVINKNIIRNYIISEFGEPQWTKLQGEIYGPLMKLATFSEGFEKFISNIHNSESAKVTIISHRTKIPDSGDSYNLHEFADEWLKKNFTQSLMNKINIFFLETIEKKIDQINTSKVDCFVDDLEKILTHPSLSEDIKRILYAPNKSDASLNAKILTIHNWVDLENMLNIEEI